MPVFNGDGMTRRRGDAADGNPSSHGDFGETARESGVLHRPAGHASGEEDRQSGRRQRIPPVLRRRQSQSRHRPDLLRFPGRARAARHQQHLADGTAGRRRGEPRLLAGSPEEGRRRDRRGRRGRRPADAAVRRRRGPAPGAGRRRRRGSGLAMGEEQRSGGAPDSRARSDRAQCARPRAHRKRF